MRRRSWVCNYVPCLLVGLVATLLPACVYGEDALGPSIVAAKYTLERINFIEQSSVSKDGLEDADP